MKLSSLRNFLVITSCGSFTRAAEQLLISQPTLSRQIKELEQELGVSLYERNKEGLQLSEAGEIVMEEAADIIERCDRLYALFRPAEKNGIKVPEILRIGIQSLFDMNELKMAVKKLQEENSETEIELIEADRHQLEQGILNNRFDAVISLQDCHENYSGLKVLPYRENTVKIAVPAGHPLTEKERIRIEELRDESFILLRREFSPIIVDRFMSTCINSGFSPYASAYANSEEECLRLAEANQGITFIHSQISVCGCERKFNVHCLDLEEPVQCEPLALICKARNRKNSLKRLIKELGLHDFHQE